MLKISTASKEETDNWGKRHWDKINVEHFGEKVEWKDEEFRFKAMEDENIIGYIYGKYEAGILTIKTLIVDQNIRGKGVGSKLIEKAEEFGKKLGAHQIILDTGKDWQARKFYEKLGFKTQAELPDYYFHQDFVIYTKKI